MNHMHKRLKEGSKSIERGKEKIRKRGGEEGLGSHFHSQMKLNQSFHVTGSYLLSCKSDILQKLLLPTQETKGLKQHT